MVSNKPFSHTETSRSFPLALSLCSHLSTQNHTESTLEKKKKKKKALTPEIEIKRTKKTKAKSKPHHIHIK